MQSYDHHVLDELEGGGKAIQRSKVQEQDVAWTSLGEGGQEGGLFFDYVRGPGHAGCAHAFVVCPVAFLADCGTVLVYSTVPARLRGLGLLETPRTQCLLFPGVEVNQGRFGLIFEGEREGGGSGLTWVLS